MNGAAVPAQEIEQALSEQPAAQNIAAPSAITDWQNALDLTAMQQRYPLLRNAL